MVREVLFSDFDIVLMSRSPRRIGLLEKLGLNFRALASDAEEIYPPDLAGSEIPVYLSRLKANSFDINNDTFNSIASVDGAADVNEKRLCGKRGDTPVIIAADTIVWAANRALGKPHDEAQAADMLKLLSGNTHKVITGVTLKHADRIRSFSEETEVEFYGLSDEEIRYYVSHYHPFDKAGAYGIQEWIGMVGVKRISGSFYNVMGLPVARLYHELLDFLF